MSVGQRLLVMPKLGLTMTEGTITEWVMAPGTRFSAGDVVFLVESEKTVTEVEAPGDGVLDEILAPAGEAVAVGTEVGRWTLAGTDGDVSTPTGESRTPRIVATPLARRRAVARGLDLSTLVGSGPGGRIQAADVDDALPAREGAAAAQIDEAFVPPDDGLPAGAVVAPTASQRTMAARLGAAKRDIPHFYLSLDVDAGRLLELRRLVDGIPERPRITVTHLLVAALVEALRRVPSMNRVWSEAGLVELSTIDVGIAVDTPRGLTSPVVRDLAGQSFIETVQSVNDVVGRARDGALRPGDIGGGAITLSNAGMHDVRYMTSIIVPGQSAILGIGSVQECFRPDERGAPVLRRELGMVLSADHRIHTGVSALGFLNELKSILQRPTLLLV